MKVELDEACDCKKPQPGYPHMGMRRCVKCNFFIIKPLRRKRLNKVRRLNVKNEFQDSRKRAQGGLPVNGIPTSARSQQG